MKGVAELQKLLLSSAGNCKTLALMPATILSYERREAESVLFWTEFINLLFIFLDLAQKNGQLNSRFVTLKLSIGTALA